jgi:TRAP-type transport system periplasmic protein
VKISNLLGAIGAVVLLVSESAVSAQTVIKVATLAPEGTPWIAHLQKWEKAAEEASGGSLDIKIFPSAQLGTEAEIFKHVQRGRVDVGVLSGAAIADNVPEIALMSTPFLFNSVSTIDCVYDEHLGNKFASLLEAKHMRFLQWQETGWMYIYGKKDLSDVNSVKGYKVRVSPSPMSSVLWKSVNAAGIELPYSETPSALQTGLINGGESAAVSFMAFGFNKVAPHLMKMNQSHLAGAITISNKTWEKLSAEERKILKESLPAVQLMRDDLRALSETLLDKHAKAGGHVHVLSDQQIAAWKARVEPNWPNFVASLGGEAKSLWPQVLKAQAACGE